MVGSDAYSCMQENGVETRSWSLECPIHIEISQLECPIVNNLPKLNTSSNRRRINRTSVNIMETHKFWNMSSNVCDFSITTETNLKRVENPAKHLRWSSSAKIFDG